jgi:hypothetical protein
VVALVLPLRHVWWLRFLIAISSAAIPAMLLLFGLALAVVM